MRKHTSTQFGSHSKQLIVINHTEQAKKLTNNAVDHKTDGSDKLSYMQLS